MRTKFWIRPIVLSVLAAFFIVGCASKPKVDWDSRIGNYTYDQAVVELGPPDREATTSDGKKVVDWVVGRSGGGGFSFGVGGYSGPVGVGVSKSTGPGPQDKILRLTFGQDGKLLTWLRN
jgi:hypothetical protein